MKEYPKELTVRPNFNLRQGIKSSLPDIKELFALVFALYAASGKKSCLVYSKEINNASTIIELEENLFTDLCNYFQSFIEDKETFRVKVNENRLFSAQIEALQVCLELFWKIAKINFIENPNDNTRERTGGNRYAKQISYATNIVLIETALSKLSKFSTPFYKDVLFNWLIKTPNYYPDSDILEIIQTFLTVFSEESQFKIRTIENKDLYFQQDGIYDVILNGNTVEDKDNIEPVGPFRILKSFLKADLHKYLKEDGQNGINIKNQTIQDDLKEYHNMVVTTLSLLPQRTTIFEDLLVVNNEVISEERHQSQHQIIFFGCPGTGKSREVERRTKGQNIIRTTFHPDADYHSFVGGYKPIMDGRDIRYAFVPQAFTLAYCNAWLQPEKPYFLIIEEINRGNCAQIFGDLFQCLDRDETGKSKYGIHCNRDMSHYLRETFENTQNQDMVGRYKREIGSQNFDTIFLPPNLFIYATMNTSDQSLFPMDSAFKRRWDWEYIPIDYEDAKTLTIVIDKDANYNWGTFIGIINPKIKALTGSEDKQLGNRFVNPINGIISFEQFRSKVVFYLWSEIYKDEVDSVETIFRLKIESDTKSFHFGDLFSNSQDGNTAYELIKGFMDFNGIATINSF